MDNNGRINCFFISDLHGRTDRYDALFRAVKEENPSAVFIGGDLLPSGTALFASSFKHTHDDFIHDFLAVEFEKLHREMGSLYPEVFLILGNDDTRFEESSILDVATSGLWQYIHNRRVEWMGYDLYGYSYVPPTPFRLKDWERYDVSRYVDPGCTAPFEGSLTVPVSASELQYATIKDDLDTMTAERDVGNAIFLFHSPPYQTKLDRAALDGQMIDYVPLDVHVGSIAIKRFIEKRQPLVTLHGHVHESARLTGSWQDSIGTTSLFSAAHDGPELAVVRFDPADLSSAERIIYPV